MSRLLTDATHEGLDLARLCSFLSFLSEHLAASDYAKAESMLHAAAITRGRPVASPSAPSCVCLDGDRPRPCRRAAAGLTKGAAMPPEIACATRPAPLPIQAAEVVATPSHAPHGQRIGRFEGVLIAFARDGMAECLGGADGRRWRLPAGDLVRVR
jgi:hypothetical protein